MRQFRRVRVHCKERGAVDGGTVSRAMVSLTVNGINGTVATEYGSSVYGRPGQGTIVQGTISYGTVGQLLCFRVR